MIRKSHFPLPPVLAALGFTFLLLPGPGTSAHGAHEPDPVELAGEILDLECYVVHQAQGRDNDLCADRHDDTERPMALLGEDGRLYILHASHHSTFPLEHARTFHGRRATITGILSQNDNVLLLEVRAIRLQEAQP